jgi:hypothetical protein
MRYLGLPLSLTRLKRVHLQFLEDKVVGKLVPWLGKHTTMAGRMVLVKAVLTSVVIYFITVLELPLEVLLKIDSIRRAYLWAACDKVSGGKCKVNWDLVCKPKEKGGLGILNLHKFASALRLRWLWLDWTDPSKPWRGLESPCNSHDKELFAAATRVTIGNGERALFWDSSWLDGIRPKDIAPLIYDISKKKRCTVRKALQNNFWVSQVNLQFGLTLEHITQFAKLWDKLSNIHINDDEQDTIIWKLTTHGNYSSSSAYKMQFEGLTNSAMPGMVWKHWATPKCKIFTWLVLQNRVWTADRLERRGWQNCGNCKLCNQVQESAAHILFTCRFTRRVWLSIKDWLGLVDVEPDRWIEAATVHEWWTCFVQKDGQSRRAMSSLAMLVSWEVWKERNARVFRNHCSTVLMVATRIKNEATLWASAGAKKLGNVMPGE